MRCAVRIAFQRDRRQRDRWKRPDLCFQLVVFRLTLRQAHVPTVMLERDLNEIRIFEGLRRAFVGCVVECPSRGGKLPDQPVEVLSVLRIARFAALGGEIEQVPPREFRARRQRIGGRGLAGDQIAAQVMVI